MNRFTKRLLIFGVSIFGFASFAFALSQAVSYKPWGVPDNRRDDYDRLVAEIDRKAELQAAFRDRPRAIARLVPATCDFGWIRAGETLRQTVLIDNVGSAELQLHDIRTGSDAVSVKLEHASLLPGESTNCLIEWVAPPDSESETIRQQVKIATNDPLDDLLVLDLQCRQRRDVVLPTSIDFGHHDIGQAGTASFVIYSQTSSDLEIEQIQNHDAFDVEWVAIPESTLGGELDDRSALVAHRINVEVESREYGQYSGRLDLEVRLNGQTKTMPIDFGGRVRPPIGFYGPHIDRHTGIDFGTVASGKRHDLFVMVRSRGDKSRRIEVLDVKPKELETEIVPLQEPGCYRMRISIPEKCPNLQFNLAEHHGFVQVGDPDAPSYSNWMPVYGVVGNFDADL